MTLNEMAGIAQSISITLAGLFAIYGFDAWRREFVGKRRMELAEEVLALFYQARDVIGEIRNPGGFASEGTTRNPSPGEKPEHKEGLARAFVLIERYQRHSELFAATYVALSIHGATWEGCRKAVRRTQQGDQRASIGRIHDVHLCHS